MQYEHVYSFALSIGGPDFISDTGWMDLEALPRAASVHRTGSSSWGPLDVPTQGKLIKNC